MPFHPIGRVGVPVDAEVGPRLHVGRRPGWAVKRPRSRAARARPRSTFAAGARPPPSRRPPWAYARGAARKRPVRGRAKRVSRRGAGAPPREGRAENARPRTTVRRPARGSRRTAGCKARDARGRWRAAAKAGDGARPGRTRARHAAAGDSMCGRKAARRPRRAPARRVVPRTTTGRWYLREAAGAATARDSRDRRAPQGKVSLTPYGNSVHRHCAATFFDGHARVATPSALASRPRGRPHVCWRRPPPASTAEGQR